MENSMVMNLIQAAVQPPMPKSGGTKTKETPDFQELLQQKQEEFSPIPGEEPKEEPALTPAEEPVPQEKDFDLARAALAAQFVEVFPENGPVVQEIPQEEVLPAQAAALPEIQTAEVLPEAEAAVLLPETENPKTTAQETPLGEFDQVMAEETPTQGLEATQTVREAPEADNRPQTQDDPQPEVTVRRGEVRQEEQEEAPETQETPVFQEVDALPIKVAEPEKAEAPRFAPAAEEFPPMEDQVDDGLLKALNEGETQVVLQLKPADLGTIRVEITQAATGALKIALSAENLHTRTILARHISSLQSTLVSADRPEVQVELQKPQEAPSQENRQDLKDGHNRQQNPQQQSQKNHRQSEDFLHQLRLGLVTPEELS